MWLDGSLTILNACRSAPSATAVSSSSPRTGAALLARLFNFGRQQSAWDWLPMVTWNRDRDTTDFKLTDRRIDSHSTAGEATEAARQPPLVEDVSVPDDRWCRRMRVSKTVSAGSMPRWPEIASNESSSSLLRPQGFIG